MKKNFLKLGGGILAVVTLSAVLFSCKNALAVVEKEGDADNSKPKAYLSIGNNVSRALFPNEWDTESEEALSYTLKVYSVSGTKETLVTSASADDLSLAQLTSASETGSKKELSLDPLIYHFYLFAYQEDESGGKHIVLQAKGIDADHSNTLDINLTTGSKNVTFNLAVVYSDGDVYEQATTKDSATATSETDIIVKFKKTAELSKVVYGIFKSVSADDKYSDALVKTASADDIAEDGKIEFTEPVPPMKDQYFGAIFYSKNSAGEEKAVGAYFARFTADGGNTTEGTVDVGDILNTYAKNPTGLTVAYEYVGDTLTKTKPTLANGNYVDATFTWDDNSNNELGFLLAIYDLGTDASTASASSTPTYAFNAKNAVATGDDITAGSLLTGSDLGPGGTTAKVRLQTNHLYVASIRAYNWLEPSSADDTKAISSTNVAILKDISDEIEKPTFNVTSGTETDITKAEPFGMYTILYDLNKGYIVNTSNQPTTKYNSASGADNTNYTQYFVRPYKYTDTPTIMTDYNHTGYTTPYVRHDDWAFVKWITLGDTTETQVKGDAADVTAKKFPGVKNITNFEYQAIWSVIANIADITFPSYQNIPETLIDGVNNASFVSVQDGKVNIKAVVVTNADGSTSDVTITVYGQDGVTKLTDSSTNAVITGTGSLTWNTAGYASGKYTIRAEADFTYKQNDGVTTDDRTVKLDQTVFVNVTN